MDGGGIALLHLCLLYLCGHAAFQAPRLCLYKTVPLTECGDVSIEVLGR